MIGKFLIGPNETPVEKNIFADKSALILEWLLRKGVNEEGFPLREVANQTGVSLGYVQKVFEELVSRGFLQIEGVRTAKKFYFKKSKPLMQAWIENYSIVKKCKLKTYRSAFHSKKEILEAIRKANLDKNIILALHSATEAYGYKNTNLNGLELYVLDPAVRLKLEKILKLEPQERGYEVLLIEPYYKSLLKLSSGEDIKVCPVLLTFLDLYHFPLRGQEQAEFMAERNPELKRIFKNG